MKLSAASKGIELIKKVTRFAFIIILSALLNTSCSQTENISEKNKTYTKIKEEKKPHEYGGWYCPDNLTNFPPVNIAELDMVPVINKRLPSKEETRTGISLIYFDPIKYPTARPMDINLPTLARYKNENTKKQELVVVIQVVICEQDTVAGFRYLNGGNGSSWYNELEFLSENEINQLSSLKFVDLQKEIFVSKDKIWKVLISPEYSKELGAELAENYFVVSDWKNRSKVHVRNDPDYNSKNGDITMILENFYLQIDYNLMGRQYVEKMILYENEDKTAIDFNLVVGPFGEDYEKKLVRWQAWLDKLAELSERL